jgi:hypothetical protein
VKGLALLHRFLPSFLSTETMVLGGLSVQIYRHLNIGRYVLTKPKTEELTSPHRSSKRSDSCDSTALRLTRTGRVDSP